MIEQKVLSALERLRQKIIENIIQQGKNATGQTVASLQVEHEGDIYRLVGRPFFPALETGRKPTDPNAPKSTPTLRERILEWVEAKGIATGREAVSASWAISRYIHANGTALYRSGQRDDVYTSAVGETIKDLQKELSLQLIKETQNIVQEYGDK